MTRTPSEIVEQVRKMVARETEDRVPFPDLFAEDGVMAYGFPAPWQPEEIKGRDEIRNYFTRARGEAWDKIEPQHVEAVTRLTDDPEVVVAEIRHRGWSKVKQDHYRFTAIAIIRVRDGQIVRYDDYMNPLALQELLGA